MLDNIYSVLFDNLDIINNDIELKHKLSCLFNNFNCKINDFYLKHVIKKKMLNMCNMIVTYAVLQNIISNIIPFDVSL